jgi:hypothetical protein
MLREAEMGQPNASREVQARLVHREQVWAALLRAVNLLLENAEAELGKQLDVARLGEDRERDEVLARRIEVLAELRREISSSPPGAQS